MKKICSFLLAVLCVLSLGLVGCGKADTTFVKDRLNDDSKYLVVYFSTTGTTSYVADLIASEANADLIRIIPKTAYPKEYDQTREIAQDEIDNDTRPEIQNKISNISKYDIIFLGFPIWFSDVPNIIKTFASAYSLSEKTIAPFCTHGISGFGSSLETLRRIFPSSAFTEGLAVASSAAKTESGKAQIKTWLDGIL